MSKIFDKNYILFNKNNLVLYSVLFCFFLLSLNSIFISIISSIFSFKGSYLSTAPLFSDFYFPFVYSEENINIFDKYLDNYLNKRYLSTYIGFDTPVKYAVPPGYFLIFQLFLTIFKFINPFYFLFLCFFLFAILIIKILQKFSDTNKYLKLILVLISQPFLFMFFTGHIFSGIIFLILMLATFLAYYNKKKKFFIFLICFLVSLRPSTIIFSLLIINYTNKSISDLLKNTILIVSLSIFTYIFLFVFSNYLNPEYNLSSHIKGLNFYNQGFAFGKGMLYNSSLLSLINFINKIYNFFILENIYLTIQILILFLFSILILFSLFLFFKNKIDTLEIMFLIYLIYILYFPILADYHLLVILIPLLLIFDEKIININKFKIIIFTILFVISPKSYFIFKRLNFVDYSESSLINPFLIFLCVIYIIAKPFFCKNDKLKLYN